MSNLIFDDIDKLINSSNRRSIEHYLESINLVFQLLSSGRLPNTEFSEVVAFSCAKKALSDYLAHLDSEGESSDE